VLSSQHGLDDAQADVDCTIRNVARMTRPVILVGHSYGDAVITAAGTDDRVVGLVYVAALGPDEDETAASEQAKFPTTDLFGQIEIADGRSGCSPTIEQVPDIPMFRKNTDAFVHNLAESGLSNVDGESNYVRIQVLTNSGPLDRDKQLAGSVAGS
jgi:pimeloyl-ACP methyl ester carboxylesterase